MSLLTVIQAVCGRTNVPKPSAVMANIADKRTLNA